jgi:hypothetical protein
MNADGTSGAISSAGTYFGTALDDMSPASPAEFSELAEVVSIGGPTETSAEIDVTHLRSPGNYREFIPSYKDGGDLPLELNFVPGSASQLALQAEFEGTQPTKRRRIFYPDGSTDTFHAYVKGRAHGASVGTKLTLHVTLRIVGPVVVEPSSQSPAIA